MNVVPHLEKVRIIAFYGRTTPLRPEALAQAVCDRFQAAARGADKLMAITELASPADRVFAQQALDLGIPLVVVLPVSAEELQKNSSAEAWNDLETFLRRATAVEVVPDDRVALTIGRKLVDEADVLLVFENADTPVEETALIVEYAQRQRREIVSIREQADPANPDEIKFESGQAQPEAGFDVLVKMLGDPPAAVQLQCPDELINYFTVCKQDADRLAPRYRKYFLNVVLANAVAAIAGTVQVVFLPPPQFGGFNLHIPLGIPLEVLVRTLIGIKFFCVVAGAVIFLVLQIRKSQSRWINSRLKAEMCRSARTTWRLPRLTESLAMGGQPEARDTLQFIRYLRAVHGSAGTVTLREFKAGYGVNRLKDQYDYYKEQADKAVALSGRLTPFYWAFTALSILAGAGSLLYSHFISPNHEPPPPGTWAYFLLGFIPIMAPAFASWILAWDAIETLGRRKARYREMQEHLHRALADLVHAETWETVGDVVDRAEKVLLNEVLEWYSFIKYSK
ncbi:MAG: hypothetical protein LV481_13745 [Methylacidiphilales bacterium]|nr:hypothetical protein [Candidatus Methylacidiphilales bacterium]